MFTLTVTSLARAVLCDDICAATNQKCRTNDTPPSDLITKLVITF